jgi:hypothetical protein
LIVFGYNVRPGVVLFDFDLPEPFHKHCNILGPKI